MRGAIEYMLLVDRVWGSGLYDFRDGKLTKVLRMYHPDGSEYYHRFDYRYIEENFSVANADDIDTYKSNYFDDNGYLLLYN